jgi:GYF domain 2
MASEWHYTQNGQAVAVPVSTPQLKQLAVSGQLKPDDLVWQEGMTSWAAASSIKGLFGPSKAATNEMPAAVRSSARSTRVEAKTDNKPQSKTDARPAPKPSKEEVEEEDAGMHPAMVFLLTVVTLGLFGLWYTFRTGSQYRVRFGKKTADSAGRPLGVVRHPVVVLALTYLTFGFYLPYWIATVLRECAAYTGQREVQSRTEMCLMLIVPFYSVYLALYRVPRMVRNVQVQAGVVEEPLPVPISLVLSPFILFVLPIVCMNQQDALNQVWTSAIE